MKQLQFYQFTTGVVLLLNIVMLAFFFITKPPSPHHEHDRRSSMRAIDILKLDKAQHDLFLESAKRHEQAIRPINEQQEKLLTSYFSTLTIANEPKDSEHILQEFQTLERTKIEKTYQHFEEIKTFLNEDQKADFELFISNILKKILPSTKKPSHPPKDI